MRSNANKERKRPAGGRPPASRPTALGRYIAEAREERGLSVNELARRVGLSGPYLSQIERGARADPHPRLLRRLASALHVSVVALMVKANYLTAQEASPRRYLPGPVLDALEDPEIRELLKNQVVRQLVVLYRQQQARRRQGERVDVPSGLRRG